MYKNSWEEDKSVKDSIMITAIMIIDNNNHNNNRNDYYMAKKHVLPWGTNRRGFCKICNMYIRSRYAENKIKEFSHFLIVMNRTWRVEIHFFDVIPNSFAASSLIRMRKFFENSQIIRPKIVRSQKNWGSRLKLEFSAFECNQKGFILSNFCSELARDRAKRFMLIPDNKNAANFQF